MNVRVGVIAACLALAGCSNREPVVIECSMDDSLVFAADAPTARWHVTEAGVLAVRSSDGWLYRRMQENETCSARPGTLATYAPEQVTP